MPSDPTATSTVPVTIAGTGSYVPEKILTNKDLEKIIDTTDEWITTRTGIKERRIAAEGQHTSDLATEAAKNALENAGVTADQVKLIIVATITPDTLTPATACYVQQKIGAPQAVAFDISAACSGFLYAMKVAKRLISDGAFENALIIGAEKLSAFTNWEDRNTCVLFGDGAGEIGTDGSLTELLKIPGGGSACPTTIANAELKLASLAMEGKEVFKHAVRRMKDASVSVIERAGLQASDIACIVPHQANLRIIDAIAERLECDNEKVFVNLEKYGNTSAAAIAIALDEANRSGAFKRGDNIVLVAFGAGFTWAAAAVKW